jgi:hypothetical protein
LKEILAVYSDGGDKKNIFVFPANEVKKFIIGTPSKPPHILHSCQMDDKHDHIMFSL